MKVNKVYPQNDEILSILKNFPNGANIDEIRLAHNSEIKIRTLQRRLAKLSEQSAIIISGNARATLYKHPAVNRVASAEVTRPAILIPISKESEQVRSLVTALIQQRKPIGYQRYFLEFYRPNVDSYLTKEE
ncbi:hypothetical protein [Flavobacterium sp. XS2P39]|uniref:hypothetical protein n=1 Tax=Flavobacterium sp. XS2P39 TaxID=3401725 RepID=UPI003AABA55C